MPATSTDLFQEWRLANRVATAAERAMLNASIQALEGKGEPPSPAEAQRAKGLRRAADDLFQLAMAHMRELAVMARTGGGAIAGPSGTPNSQSLTRPRG